MTISPVAPRESTRHAEHDAFGYAHGYGMARKMKTAIPWDNENEWRISGARLHKLQGLVVPAPLTREASVGRPQPFVRRVTHGLPAS